MTIKLVVFGQWQCVEYWFQKLLLCRAEECSKSNQEIQMILVTGATGNNGLEVLKRLASQNVQARAMVRAASGTRERARNRAKAIADLGILYLAPVGVSH
jgi:hypothetical protein